jgi:hypothetical protein
VATLACAKVEDRKLDLLRLKGSEMNPVLGTTPMRSANSLHGVLDWMPEALAQLVELLLAAARRSQRYNPRAVRDAGVALREDDVEPGEHRDWVLRLKATHQPTT